MTNSLSPMGDWSECIMPKCISRFKYEVAKFHSEDMNVVGFGGLKPNGTGCQFNLSSLCTHLSKRLGRMGSWHPDSKDDHTWYTLFILLLKIGPSKLCFYQLFWAHWSHADNYSEGNPGTFCLSQGGVYVHEQDAWIVFIVFKGNNLHSGFTTREDPIAHQEWVDSIKEPTFNLKGDEVRGGFVIYYSAAATQCTVAMNMIWCLPKILETLVQHNLRNWSNWILPLTGRRHLVVE